LADTPVECLSKKPAREGFYSYPPRTKPDPNPDASTSAGGNSFGVHTVRGLFVLCSRLTRFVPTQCDIPKNVVPPIERWQVEVDRGVVTQLPAPGNELQSCLHHY
jgi:hypothetical protein